MKGSSWTYYKRTRDIVSDRNAMFIITNCCAQLENFALQETYLANCFAIWFFKRPDILLSLLLWNHQQGSHFTLSLKTIISQTTKHWKWSHAFHRGLRACASAHFPNRLWRDLATRGRGMGRTTQPKFRYIIYSRYSFKINFFYTEYLCNSIGSLLNTKLINKVSDLKLQIWTRFILKNKK